MAKQKKLEKAARKALARAEAAVAEARAATERLDAKKAAKAKKRAKALQKELSALIGRPTIPDAGRPADPVDLTPPLPSVHDDQVEVTAEFAGSAATSAPHDPELDGLTVQALRDVARARGLRNVSKLTKGQLIERLSE